MDKESQPYTAFQVPNGQTYMYLRSPFGALNLVAQFSRLMSECFAGLLFVILMAYINDIFVYSKTFKEMVERLDIVLGRIISCGFKIKPEKVTLCKRK